MVVSIKEGNFTVKVMWTSGACGKGRWASISIISLTPCCGCRQFVPLAQPRYSLLALTTRSNLP